MDQKKRELVERITRQLTDDGRVIEAGWESLRIMTIPDNAPAMQLGAMRDAFFADAQHLFGSMVTIMDADEEPTDNDLFRMGQIDAGTQAVHQGVFSETRAVNNEPPSKAWLAESRRRYKVPDEWVWHWCVCGQVVWVPPDVQAITEARGAEFVAVCSATCVQRLVSKLAEQGEGGL